MVQEVSALMGAADEEEWARAGLFNTVDELSFKSVGRVNQNGLTASWKQLSTTPAGRSFLDTFVSLPFILVLLLE